jgi:hypothetical protein
MNRICHSGGADGADTAWEFFGLEYDIITNAYSYKTSYHRSPSKVEISDEDYREGISKIEEANKVLKRKNIHKYMNLLARNWSQVKYSDEIFAVGTINVKAQLVNGGTGYACQMAIDHNRPVFVFEQEKNKWFEWSYLRKCFVVLDETPIITKENFAGIGTRDLNTNGIEAIKSVYRKTYNNFS